MIRPHRKTGFTLIELLTAVALVVLVVSCLYGSFYASTQSARRCQTRMGQDRQAQSLLDLMSRQIRCSYTDDSMAGPVTPQNKNQLMPPVTVAASLAISGELTDTGGLRLITTVGRNTVGPLQDIWEAVYRFDTHRGMVTYRQRPYRQSSSSWEEKADWVPLAENLDEIKVEFYDGQSWYPRWPQKTTASLPILVRLTVSADSATPDQNWTLLAAPYGLWESRKLQVAKP